MDVRHAIEGKIASVALRCWDDETVAVLREASAVIEGTAFSEIVNAMVYAAEGGLHRQAEALQELGGRFGGWFVQGLLNDYGHQDAQPLRVSRADLEAHRELGEITARIVKIARESEVIV